MIDEYQDSNYVQETILRAVSREEAGHNNIFMVGDVKQSIYRFRLARPELFIEKYKTYTSTDSCCQKIDLHQNFRSRKEVVESVNRIFYQIMHEDLGNVEYDKQAALYAGASWYEAAKQPDVFQSELLLASADPKELEGAGIHDQREAEAGMTAVRIKQLLENGLVTDSESGRLRPVRFKDIVILLRSISGWADTFSRVLAEAGIPAHTASRTGYFGAIEIQTILSLLSILDNPLQDIPLAATLTSPVGGFDGEQLAQIRTESKEHFYYLALVDYAQYGSQEALREKAAGFLRMYDRLRGLTAFTPVHRLIQTVLRETGYGAYIQAMPAGARRRANVDMLLEKAIAYEKTSYKGLFHFIRYIEKLKKYEVDFGEADITSENEDVVRIMSIHKSKGLEFPIVFVCGMGKQFNRQDTRSRMILHPEYGIGLDFIDADHRIRKPGFIKKVLENQTGMENQGEELRVLYVALTRAKEKLIMTATVKKEPDTGQIRTLADDAPMDYVSRLDASRMRTLHQTAVREVYEQIDQKLSWKYPFEADTVLKTKISVSELKHRNKVPETAELPAEEMFAQEQFVEEPELLLPAFMRKEEETENRGALRGSAVHKVLEELDFVQMHESSDPLADLRQLTEDMLVQGHITPEMKQLLNLRMIRQFLDSPLAARMAEAQNAGTLHKEQPFVMGIRASEIFGGTSGELVLIQGIVDAYWEEGEEIVILDYKTDFVKEAGQLLERYAIQLNLYGEALEKATGKRVKEKLMYSFRLREVVEVKAGAEVKAEGNPVSGPFVNTHFHPDSE